MGIRLIVEVLDHWQDVGLTAGERNDLLVLAENANDRTRLTWGPVHEPYILRRANKTPEGWKNSIGKLLRKKALTTHTPGRIKQAAVYHLEPLCPDPPHDGFKGFCTRPPKEEPGLPQGGAGATPQEQEGHLSGDPLPEEGHLSGDPMGHPSGDPLGQEGHLTGAERVTGEVTPTPLFSSSKSPSNTPSSSVADESGDLPAEAGKGEGGGGGDHSPNQDLAREIAAVLDYKGKQPDRRQQRTIVDGLAAALDAGWALEDLAAYLNLGGTVIKTSAASLYVHRLKPDVIPDPPKAAERRETKLPPACEQCLDWSPGAATNVRLRADRMSFGGGACPRCHPSKVPGDWWWPGKEPDTTSGKVADLLGEGDMWDRAMNRALARKAQSTGARAEAHTAADYMASSVADLFAPRAEQQLTGTDAKVAGWMALSRGLAADSNEREFATRPYVPRPMIAPPHQPYTNPTDQSVYDEPFGPGPAADQSAYDEDF